MNPHLFDPDYSDRLWRELGGDAVPVLDCGDAHDVEPAKRTRRPSISSVIRQMKRAGIEIAGFEINRDGVIKVVAGKPVGADVEITTPIDRSEWN